VHSTWEGRRSARRGPLAIRRNVLQSRVPGGLRLPDCRSCCIIGEGTDDRVAGSKDCTCGLPPSSKVQFSTPELKGAIQHGAAPKGPPFLRGRCRSSVIRCELPRPRADLMPCPTPESMHIGKRHISQLPQHVAFDGRRRGPLRRSLVQLLHNAGIFQLRMFTSGLGICGPECPSVQSRHRAE
jgi:hypothetical protein